MPVYLSRFISCFTRKSSNYLGALLNLCRDLSNVPWITDLIAALQNISTPSACLSSLIIMKVVPFKEYFILCIFPLEIIKLPWCVAELWTRFCDLKLCT